MTTTVSDRGVAARPTPVLPRPSVRPAPAPAAPASTPAPAGEALRWIALRYRLPQAGSGVRSAVWRDLVEAGGLSLRYGVWALPRGRDAELLDAVVDRIRAAGGEAIPAPVGSEDEDDIVLGLRLTRACERLWDSFFNTADLLRTQLALGSGSAATREALLDQLVDEHASALSRDLVRSEAAARAGARLDELVAETRSTRVPLEGPPARHRIEARTVHALEDGRVRLTAVIDPLPSMAWLEAFDALEAVLYLPSPDRVASRYGTFTWVGPGDAVDEALEALDRRIAQFARSRG